MYFKKERSFYWLLSQDISKIKEISRVLLAFQLWNVETDLARKLIEEKNDGHWNNSIRDTSRSISALAKVEENQENTKKWILAQQENGAWNNDVYDTTYALMALADMGIYNLEGCRWLVDNYSSEWEYPGTNSLIINALIKQGKLDQNDEFSAFINEHAKWILGQRDKNGAWKTIATSNICIQALILAGYHEELSSDIEWVLEKMNHNGSWGKNEASVTATALSLITLAQFTKKNGN